MKRITLFLVIFLSVMFMAQGGAAAALSVQRKIPSRDIPAQDIVALTMEHGAVSV